MRRLLFAWVLLLAGIACASQSDAFWQSRDSNYNISIGGGGSIATNSLSFVAASSQYLSATGKTGINQQKFSFAIWFKTTGAASQFFFNFGDGTANNRVFARLNGSGTLSLLGITAASTVMSLVTTASFNDGNWHSLVGAVDTTQATAANSVLIYADCALLSSFSTATYPPQNTNLSNNFAASYFIGANTGPANFWGGNQAQVYYIDGQAKDYTAFNNASCKPKTYSGTYAGTFDFFLPFSNGTSTTTLGADGSGEGNNWTLNAMTTANQSTDHP